MEPAARSEDDAAGAMQRAAEAAAAGNKGRLDSAEIEGLTAASTTDPDPRVRAASLGALARGTAPRCGRGVAERGGRPRLIGTPARRRGRSGTGTFGDANPPTRTVAGPRPPGCRGCGMGARRGPTRLAPNRRRAQCRRARSP
ncbi:MAG: hypothetical protein M5T61_08815 [Acidimicrobiia bacterium]|nr:hypothetical protein [Acidimicrobiia bacterium]